MNVRKQIELGNKVKKALALKTLGYSNAEIAKQIDVPEELCKAIFDYLEQRGDL